LASGDSMKIVTPSYEILLMPDRDTLLKVIETAGRTCYKSEHRMTGDSAERFIGQAVKLGHHSIIEHAGITVRFICDRGVTHELVRHRLASFSQESTRYVNYHQDRFGREITVVRPPFWPEDSEAYRAWAAAMERAEKAYMDLIDLGASPEQARTVLPNSLKTELVMTANLREWRHILQLRCSPAAHPQVRELLTPLLKELARRVPVLFDDILRAEIPAG
jgi:thymidylate synthase (FAD)